MKPVFKHIAGLVLAIALGSAIAVGHTGARAQELKQMKLTEQHIQGFIASQKELSAMADRLQEAGDKPDPQLQAELEALAKRHGFASFAELDDVAANISVVMAGLDPQTGDYADPLDTIKQEMEDIKADASIPENDKKQMLEEMTAAIKTTPPLQYKENVEVVKRHRTEIEKVLQ
ncbi:MAG TPA: hypothetical protein VE665_00665 [Hyphomicrobiaceae bacterium]|jgi:hypothetical protein|nr:hypothetical protein [Hyphomicrobiaceae bacterium]